MPSAVAGGSAAPVGVTDARRYDGTGGPLLTVASATPSNVTTKASANVAAGGGTVVVTATAAIGPVTDWLPVEDRLGMRTSVALAAGIVGVLAAVVSLVAGEEAALPTVVVATVAVGVELFVTAAGEPVRVLVVIGVPVVVPVPVGVEVVECVEVGVTVSVGVFVAVGDGVGTGGGGPDVSQ